MNKVVITILQGSVVTQTVLSGIMCQILLKLVGTRQSYGTNKQAYFFRAYPVYYFDWWNVGYLLSSIIQCIHCDIMFRL